MDSAASFFIAFRCWRRKSARGNFTAARSVRGSCKSFANFFFFFFISSLLLTEQERPAYISPKFEF